MITPGRTDSDHRIAGATHDVVDSFDLIGNVDDLIGIGGFDTWSADVGSAPLRANVTDVIVLGQDGRPPLLLS